jgi:glutaminyl-peptide cyclotransferase
MRAVGKDERPGSNARWLVAAIAAAIVLVAVLRLRDASRADEEIPFDDSDGEVEAPPDAADEGEPPPPHDPPAERLVVRIVHTYPHDTEAFTQGLLWHDGHLYESTGQYGRSSLRKVALETGEVLERRDIPARLFSEGLALVGDRLYQLSWMEHEAQVWTLDGFDPVRTFRYEGEGWGLCWDGEHLVMSDGSDHLFFRDPETFEVEGEVLVHHRGEGVRMLNELECVDGTVWANVWQQDRILRIDPESGRVTAIVNAAGLLTREEAAHADVLNGIAWIPERNHFVITGKEWPHLYEVEFVPRGS